MRTLSRLPGGDGQARATGRRRTPMPICSAARRACSPARAAGLDLFVIDAPHLFDRPGNPYLGPDGLDWPDNALRFAALARVGADIGLGAVAAFRPDVVHAHDWQAALAPAYLHYAAAASRHGDHHPQHRVPGPLSPASISRRSACPRAR
jgi:hypothetical protein